MPHWTCDQCGTRLYSASESLKWQDCPVCAGRLSPEGEDPSRLGRERDEEHRVPERPGAR